MVGDNFISKLTTNLLDMLNDEKYHDIIIEVGSEPHTKIFHAHKIILNYRSPYFQKILSTEEDRTLKLPNILPNTFQVILR
jgi:hypothetical protein